MNIPPKYEDVVAQLEAYRKSYVTRLAYDALQQRLNVAEQRADELENELRDALEWIESGDRIPYNMVRSIKAALKPAEECLHNYSNPTGCPVCQGIKP